MIAKTTVLLAASLLASFAMAEGCEVSTRSTAADDINAVTRKSCYEFKGMPDGSINWSCSNESQQMLATTKHKVAACDDGYDASCSASMTQATVTNHKAVGVSGSDEVNITADARVVTYYYSLENRSQAKDDCERSGGKWQDHP